MTDAENQAREAAHAGADAVQDIAGKAAAVASDTVSKAADTATHAVGVASDAVTDTIDATRQEVVAGARQAAELVSGMSDRAVAEVRHHPMRTVLLVALCAAVVGFLVGTVTAKPR